MGEPMSGWGVLTSERCLVAESRAWKQAELGDLGGTDAKMQRFWVLQTGSHIKHAQHILSHLQAFCI